MAQFDGLRALREHELRVLGGPRDAGNCLSEVLYIAALYRKDTKTLTWENVRQLAQQVGCAHLHSCVQDSLHVRRRRAGREGDALGVREGGRAMLQRGGSGPSLDFCQRLRVGFELKAHAGSVEAVAYYQV
jgi:hypothetical protein